MAEYVPHKTFEALTETQTTGAHTVFLYAADASSSDGWRVPVNPDPTTPACLMPVVGACVRTVLLSRRCDYCGPPTLIPQLAQRCERVVLIDHHKTAQELVDSWKASDSIPSNGTRGV